MAVHTYSAAKMICELGNWQVTNLKLQKVLYLAHMVHMGRNCGKRLIDAQFEAWAYGPVEPNLYQKVKMFGARPIQDIFFVDTPDPQSDEGLTLISASKNLLIKSPAQLVAITHREQGAWAKNYVMYARGNTISDEDILEEYRTTIAA